MAYLGLCLVVMTYTVTSAVPASICPKDIKPVCGSDGRTYDNECIMKYQDQTLTVRHKGECRDTRAIQGVCTCSSNYEPVCGKNNQTFRNICSLECSNVRFAYSGECRPNYTGECYCPIQYQPVCGTDGHTYGNLCQLNHCSQSVNLAYVGKCRDKRDDSFDLSHSSHRCNCRLNFAPVCGSNGHNYPNFCMMKCDVRDIQLAYTGLCMKPERDQSLPSCLCPAIIIPVCGTDDRTYSNPCQLDCNRQLKKDLRVLHRGPCENDYDYDDIEAIKRCFCTKEFSPVCASNGVSYTNKCSMRCANPKLTVEKEGPCDYDYEYYY